MKDKTKHKMADVANKARRMIGLGPVDNLNINEIEKELGSRAEAEKKVVIELLKESLEFDQEDIEALNILETKQAASSRHHLYRSRESQPYKRDLPSSRCQWAGRFDHS